MPRAGLALLSCTVAALAAAPGCGPTTTPPPADPRAEQIALVPAPARFVAQVDVPRVFAAEDLGRWLQWQVAVRERAIDTGCVGTLAGRAGVVTAAVVPSVEGLGEELIVLFSGELTAAELATCAVTVLGREGDGAPEPGPDGRYVVGEEGEQVAIADLPGGGVVAGMAERVAAVLAGPPAAAVAGGEALTRLQGLLGGPAEGEAYLLEPMGGGDFGIEGAAVRIARGPTDRYEIVLLAGSIEDADALSLMVVAVPLLIAQAEAQFEMAAGEGDPAGTGEEMLAALLPVLAEVRGAVGEAVVTTEGETVRIVMDVDPTVAAPADLLAAAGALLFAQLGADLGEGFDEPPPPPNPPEYSIPGVPPAVPGSDGQPPVE